MPGIAGGVRDIGDRARNANGSSTNRGDRGKSNDPFRKKKDKNKTAPEAGAVNPELLDPNRNQGNQSGLGGNRSNDAAKSVSGRQKLRRKGSLLTGSSSVARTAKKLLLGS